MTDVQLDVIVDFMASHEEFARDGDLGITGHSTKNQLWKTLTSLVCSSGAAKTVPQCMNVSLEGIKKRALDKRAMLNKIYRRTGNPSIPEDLVSKERDLRILDIWGSTQAVGLMNGSAGPSSSGTITGFTTRSPEAVLKKRKSRPQRRIEAASSVSSQLLKISLESAAQYEKFVQMMQQHLPPVFDCLKKLEVLPSILENQQVLLRRLTDRSACSSVQNPWKIDEEKGGTEPFPFSIWTPKDQEGGFGQELFKNEELSRCEDPGKDEEEKGEEESFPPSTWNPNDEEGSFGQELFENDDQTRCEDFEEGEEEKGGKEPFPSSTWTPNDQEGGFGQELFQNEELTRCKDPGEDEEEKEG